MDVHVNRVPVSGRVTRVTLIPGRFLPAYRHDAGTINERSEIWIDHDGQMVVARQIVGILARRVVCRLEVGATVRAGDRYGIMKFGSRMDMFRSANCPDPRDGRASRARRRNGYRSATVVASVHAAGAGGRASR